MGTGLFAEENDGDTKEVVATEGGVQRRRVTTEEGGHVEGQEGGSCRRFA
jgi:hypothetical protein